MEETASVSFTRKGRELATSSEEEALPFTVFGKTKMGWACLPLGLVGGVGLEQGEREWSWVGPRLDGPRLARLEKVRVWLD